METDRANEADLGPPSPAEDQHSDNRLECHQQTDKQVVVRRDNGTPGCSHPAEVRLVSEVGISLPKSKVHGVERSPAHEHEHAHGDTSDVSRPPTPYRQNTGHDRGCDAGHPEDLHPSVFLHATLLDGRLPPGLCGPDG